MKDKINKIAEDFNVSDRLEKIRAKKKKIMRRVAMIVVLCIVGVFAGGVGVFTYAKSKVNYTENQMMEIALNKVPGKVLKVEKEFSEHDLTFEYEFKIKDKENMLREVTVNANSGAIVDLEPWNNYGYDEE